MNAKMDFSTSYPEMVVKVVIVIRLEALTHLVNVSPDSVIVNQVLLGMYGLVVKLIEKTNLIFNGKLQTPL